jgi:hypothetical protein
VDADGLPDMLSAWQVPRMLCKTHGVTNTHHELRRLRQQRVGVFQLLRTYELKATIPEDERPVCAQQCTVLCSPATLIVLHVWVVLLSAALGLPSVSKGLTGRPSGQVDVKRGGAGDFAPSGIQ